MQGSIPYEFSSGLSLGKLNADFTPKSIAPRGFISWRQDSPANSAFGRKIPQFAVRNHQPNWGNGVDKSSKIQYFVQILNSFLYRRPPKPHHPRAYLTRVLVFG